MIIRGKLVDLLQTAADVAQWADMAGLRIRSNPGTDILAPLVELREALTALFAAKLEKRRVPRDTLVVINKYLALYPTTKKLCFHAGKLQLGPVNDRLSADDLLGKVAYEAAQLVVSPKIERLKKCFNQKCVLLFIDTSRANRRRWCSMKTCGNRAKAASHYLNSKV